MATLIHETAVIDPRAQLGSGVTIGPYSIVDGDVVIGDNVKIGNHCVFKGHTKIGQGCQFFTGAVIGSISQDKKYGGQEEVALTIGENNIFREYVTVNLATVEGGGETQIGSGNFFMAYSHVAHDCKVGNNCTFANLATLGGHVEVEDRAVVGGLTGVHQFVRIGKYAIIGGCSKVVQDVPPYSMCDGNPAEVMGINTVGLKRANFSSESMMTLRRAFKILFHSGHIRSHAIDEVKEKISLTPEIQHLIEFISRSKRGVAS